MPNADWVTPAATNTPCHGAPGLFWKTEYRYAEFSGARLPQVVWSTGLANTNFYDSKKFEQTIRTELVWRFNWGRY
jgi:outer membrane immunogenic protein